MILDVYFRRPIFWDYLLSIIICSAVFIAVQFKKVSLPQIQDSYSLTGDLTNIALTLVGFVLTILTLLITFKENSATNSSADKKVFTSFFSTAYYHETVRHLKNCIKSITLIAAIGFSLKLFLSADLRGYLFYYNAFGILIIMLSIGRCLIILGKILDLQNSK